MPRTTALGLQACRVTYWPSTRLAHRVLARYPRYAPRSVAGARSCISEAGGVDCPAAHCPSHGRIRVTVMRQSASSDQTFADRLPGQAPQQLGHAGSGNVVCSMIEYQLHKLGMPRHPGIFKGPRRRRAVILPVPHRLVHPPVRCAASRVRAVIRRGRSFAGAVGDFLPLPLGTRSGSTVEMRCRIALHSLRRC